jgi:hypothetical protein
MEAGVLQISIVKNVAARDGSRKMIKFQRPIQDIIQREVEESVGRGREHACGPITREPYDRIYFQRAIRDAI